MTQIARNCDSFGLSGQDRRPMRWICSDSALASLPGFGNCSTNTSASWRASGSGRMAPGDSAISRANCSTASRLHSDDRRPASSHGSRPRRVSAEITLSGTPSLSSPTVENRKPSRSGRSGRNDFRRVIAACRPIVPPPVPKPSYLTVRQPAFSDVGGQNQPHSARALAWPAPGVHSARQPDGRRLPWLI